MDRSASGVRGVVLPVRLLVAAAAVLVTIAGTQLFALADQTDFYFAWTIKPPLNAAFLGAAYWASLFLLLDIVFGATWRQARTGLFSIFTFTSLTLVVTLLHLDRFHFGAAETLPVVAAWAWLIVYVTTPLAFAVGLWVQVRMPGGDSPRGGPLPAPLRLLFLFQTVVFAVFGIALLVAPAEAAAWWPWNADAADRPRGGCMARCRRRSRRRRAHRERPAERRRCCPELRLPRRPPAPRRLALRGGHRLEPPARLALSRLHGAGCAHRNLGRGRRLAVTEPAQATMVKSVAASFRSLSSRAKSTAARPSCRPRRTAACRSGRCR